MIVLVTISSFINNYGAVRNEISKIFPPEYIDMVLVVGRDGGLYQKQQNRDEADPIQHVNLHSSFVEFTDEYYCLDFTELQLCKNENFSKSKKISTAMRDILEIEHGEDPAVIIFFDELDDLKQMILLLDRTYDIKKIKNVTYAVEYYNTKMVVSLARDVIENIENTGRDSDGVDFSDLNLEEGFYDTDN